MTAEKITQYILLISLGLAAIVVFSSFFLPNHESMQAITYVLITIWLVPFSYLRKLKKKSSHAQKEEQL